MVKYAFVSEMVSNSLLGLQEGHQEQGHLAQGSGGRWSMLWLLAVPVHSSNNSAFYSTTYPQSSTSTSTWSGSKQDI